METLDFIKFHEILKKFKDIALIEHKVKPEHQELYEKFKKVSLEINNTTNYTLQQQILQQILCYFLEISLEEKGYESVLTLIKVFQEFAKNMDNKSGGVAPV